MKSQILDAIMPDMSDLNLEPFHRAAADQLPKPKTVSRPDVKTWSAENGMPYIPETPTDIQPKRPWYKKTPTRCAWLIRPLQFLRRKWDAIFLGVIVGALIFVDYYVATCQWLG